MKNEKSSLITEIRDENKSNYILSRFSQNSFNRLTGYSKYHIQIFTDDLPRPVYIFALFLLDSTNFQRRITFFPQIS